MGRGGRSGGGGSGGGFSSRGSFSSRSSSSGSFSSRSSSSSSRGRSSVSSSSSSNKNNSSRSGSSHTPPPRPFFIPRSSKTIINNYGGPSNRNIYNNQPVSSGADNRSNGVLGAMIVAVIVMFIVIMVLLAGRSSDTTVSTVNREPLPAGICIESKDWYDDKAGWIGSESKLLKGMKKFYQATGVQPYLIITESVNKKGGDLTDTEAEQYLMDTYDTLFNDKGHMILMFMEYADSEYMQYIYAGNQASTVIDNEAKEIIFDYVDHYYTSSLDEDEYFSTAFEKSAERIMKKTTTNKDIVSIMMIFLGITAGILIIGIVIVYKKKAEAKKAEEERRILETPISNLNDPLKEKYKDK